MSSLLLEFFMIILCLGVSPTPSEAIEASAALMNTCDHVYRVAPGSSAISEQWYSLNDLYHEHRSFTLSSCINEGCSVSSQVCIATKLSQHTWEYTGTNYHLTDQTVHIYVHECSVCQTDQEVQLPCGGSGRGDCPMQLPTPGTQWQK